MMQGHRRRRVTRKRVPRDRPQPPLARRVARARGVEFNEPFRQPDVYGLTDGVGRRQYLLSFLKAQWSTPSYWLPPRSIHPGFPHPYFIQAPVSWGSVCQDDASILYCSDENLCIIQGRSLSESQMGSKKSWRRGGDSNPRCRFQHNCLAGSPVQPLQHLSGWGRLQKCSERMLYCRKCGSSGQTYPQPR